MVEDGETRKTHTHKLRPGVIRLNLHHLYGFLIVKHLNVHFY